MYDSDHATYVTDHTIYVINHAIVIDHAMYVTNHAMYVCNHAICYLSRNTSMITPYACKIVRMRPSDSESFFSVRFTPIKLLKIINRLNF